MKDLKRLTKDEFPPLLHQIPEPPKQLFVQGTLPDFQKNKFLAVVGSRSMTSYGKRACQELIAGLKGYPIVIVSGLAYGVDAEAHKAAVDNDLITIAIPGSGLDEKVLYPKANKGLAKEIVEKGGAMLSEFAPDTVATPYTFPERNRIVVGMCNATLVIEAKEKSGSLISARLCVEYNRELLVLPGSIFSEESRGTHQFLKLGATPVTESKDILEALGIEIATVEKAAPKNLSEKEQKVWDLLTQPMQKDEILKLLDIEIMEANMLLTMMEISGHIHDFGGTIARA